jgi:transposase
MALIILNDHLRGELEELVLRTPLAKERCRAQAVLWLAEGLPAEQIAETFQVSRQTVYNWADRFRQREGLDLRARLLDATRPGRPPSISGIIDPLIDAVFAQDPRELGYHATVWTAQLLVEYLEQAHGIKASRKSVSLAIARLRLRWKRPRHQLAAQQEHWRQAKGGLKHGLKERSRTLLLMLDETIVTETPPLYSCSGPIGEQVRVPISGEHAKRVLHGAINIRSGDLALLITDDWTQESHEAFLRLIRTHWRGWNLVLFEDRATQHKAARAWAQKALKIETRLLPKATPELNPMDHLWRHMKRETLASRATLSIEVSALAACQYLIDMSPRDRLEKAGVLSGHFWLTL